MRSARALGVAFASLSFACGARTGSPAAATAPPVVMATAWPTPAPPPPWTPSAAAPAPQTAARLEPVAPPTTTPPAEAPTASPAAVSPAVCAAANDCASCNARSGCAWCGYPRGCLPADARASCSSSNAWITRGAWCASVDYGVGVSGLAPVGAPKKGRLETLTKLEWPVKRGLCYELVVRLAEGATLDRSQLFGALRDTVQETNGPMTVVFGATPPVLGEPVCPRGPGTFALKVKDVYDNFVTPMRGRGAFEAQLLARPIDDGTLRTREREQDERYRRGMCKACREDYAGCFFRGDTGCDAELAECLRFNGIAPDQCR